MEPLTSGTGAVTMLHTHAMALLQLGRAEQARPMTITLLAKGWSHPDLFELCRQYDL